MEVEGACEQLLVRRRFTGNDLDVWERTAVKRHEAWAALHHARVARRHVVNHAAIKNFIADALISPNQNPFSREILAVPFFPRPGAIGERKTGVFKSPAVAYPAFFQPSEG